MILFFPRIVHPDLKNVQIELIEDEVSVSLFMSVFNLVQVFESVTIPPLRERLSRRLQDVLENKKLLRLRKTLF